jgi:TolB protein
MITNSSLHRAAERLAFFRQAIPNLFTAALSLPVIACAPPEAPRSAATTPWTPSQSDLLFTSNHEGNSEIYIRKAGDDGLTNLTNSAAPENWPVWSPGGDRVLFQSRVDGNLDIFVMNADGSNVRQLTDNPAHDYVPTWSHDGRQIYFASWRVERGETEAQIHFYVMNEDGGDQQRIAIDSPETSGPLVSSADGQLLAYSRRLGEGRSVIRLRQVGTGVERDLTTPEGYVGAPSFSPDGTRLAFYVQQGEASKIFTAEIASGALREMVSTGRNYEPKWSPDSRWLMVTVSSSDDDQDLDLWLFDTEGTAPPMPLRDTEARTSEGRWRPPPENASMSSDHDR